MIHVFTIFLQNITIQHHVALEVCKYFFSHFSPRHQMTFGKIQAITGSLVIHG